MSQRVPLPAAIAELPVAEVLDDVVAELGTHRRAVLTAPPGAGKTTAVPLALAGANWLGDQRIIVLEPRRLAARAAAQRMADLLGQQPGDLVGYQTRDERRIGPATRIEVVTEGVLTRRLQHDPALTGVGVVIFDEAHERNLPTDLGLALALDVRRVLRDDLAILVMSATIDASAFTRVLDDAPVITSDGRTHPVEIIWRPPTDGTRRGPARPPVPGRGRVDDAAVVDAIRHALAHHPGDVLVFLPGIGEIRRIERALGSIDLDGVDVYPLAGALDLRAHDAALAASPPGRRRVVLSTDIAESSLTVTGIRIVIDAGLARVPRFDAASGMTRLVTVDASRASADQRAGRAGRTEPGVCYRLWRRGAHTTRPRHLPAEILQTDLTGLALEIAAWGTPVEALRFVDPPPERTLRDGTEVLGALGAIDADGRATALGRRLLELPVHPRLAKMITSATSPGDAACACVVATILEERDPMRGRPSELPADLALRVALVVGDTHDDRADRSALRRLRDHARDLARRARAPFDDVPAHRAGAVALAAYPDRLAVSRGRPGQFQLRSGVTATLDADDPLAHERFLVAASMQGARSGARILLAGALDAGDVAATLDADVEQRGQLTWDTTGTEVVLRTETRLGGMLLAATTATPPPGEATIAFFTAHVRERGLGVFDDPATQLRARVAFARAHDPTGEWPDWSDDALLGALDEWLVPFLAQVTSAASLRALDIDMILSASLGWDTSMRLSQFAPVAFAPPTGRDVPIDYRRDSPTVSVRAQRLFGLDRHPTIADGRVPLTIEVLSPADRPVQITSDLPGFWRGSWADVRREMRGRYPKHDWPEHPERGS